MAHAGACIGSSLLFHHGVWLSQRFLRFLFRHNFRSLFSSVSLSYPVCRVAPFTPTGFRSITLRVATLPSTFFDGTDEVVFTAIGVGADGGGGDGDDEDDDGHSNSAAAHQAQGAGDALSSPQGGAHSVLHESSSSSTGEASRTASFNVTFFHCAAGSFWERDTVSGNDLDEYTGNCTSCADGDLDSLTEV